MGNDIRCELFQLSKARAFVHKPTTSTWLPCRLNLASNVNGNKLIAGSLFILFIFPWSLENDKHLDTSNMVEHERTRNTFLFSQAQHGPWHPTRSVSRMVALKGGSLMLAHHKAVSQTFLQHETRDTVSVVSVLIATVY